MLADLGYALLSVFVVLVTAIAISPERAECPRGWWVNGVRPSGSFECIRDVRPEADNEHGELRTIEGRVDCPPSFMPIVETERRVACRNASTIP